MINLHSKTFKSSHEQQVMLTVPISVVYGIFHMDILWGFGWANNAKEEQIMQGLHHFVGGFMRKSLTHEWRKVKRTSHRFLSFYYLNGRKGSFWESLFIKNIFIVNFFLVFYSLLSDNLRSMKNPKDCNTQIKVFPLWNCGSFVSKENPTLTPQCGTMWYTLWSNSQLERRSKCERLCVTEFAHCFPIFPTRKNQQYFGISLIRGNHRHGNQMCTLARTWGTQVVRWDAGGAPTCARFKFPPTVTTTMRHFGGCVYR